MVGNVCSKDTLGYKFNKKDLYAQWLFEFDFIVLAKCNKNAAFYFRRSSVYIREMISSSWNAVSILNAQFFRRMKLAKTDHAMCNL